MLDQWFSTGVPQNPWVPRKALGVPPISGLDLYFLVYCSKVCCQIVKKPRKGAANQKRLRHTVLDGMPNREKMLVVGRRKKVENPCSNPLHRLTHNSNHSHIFLTQKFFWQNFVSLAEKLHWA